MSIDATLDKIEKKLNSVLHEISVCKRISERMDKHIDWVEKILPFLPAVKQLFEREKKNLVDPLYDIV